MKPLFSLIRNYMVGTSEPFVFTRDNDKTLEYKDLKGLGLYIHIPFCRSICAFCPYCKEIYQEEKAASYLDALIKEIHMVGSAYQEKTIVGSLYFGGGSPALVANRLKDIIAAVEEHFIITDGIGIELHPSDVNVETLKLLKDAGVTKISIGIQSFQDKYQSILGRRSFNASMMKEALREVPFETVSMDFIFALPEQTKDDLIADVSEGFSIGANHVAIYPFIDFDFTPSRVKPLEDKEKRKLLDDIDAYCVSKGYRRSSIWTFAKDSDNVYSSMSRDTFLGFGVSATTLLKDSFKINTFSVSEYQKAISEGRLPTSLTIHFKPRQRMAYYLFWKFYSTRFNPSDFEAFFGEKIDKKYRLAFFIGRLKGWLKKEGKEYRLTTKGIFYYHQFENYYTLAYIDKMWGILKSEAYPERISL